MSNVIQFPVIADNEIHTDDQGRFEQITRLLNVLVRHDSPAVFSELLA